MELRSQAFNPPSAFAKAMSDKLADKHGKFKIKF